MPNFSVKPAGWPTKKGCVFGDYPVNVRGAWRVRSKPFRGESVYYYNMETQAKRRFKSDISAALLASLFVLISLISLVSGTVPEGVRAPFVNSRGVSDLGLRFALKD